MAELFEQYADYCLWAMGKPEARIVTQLSPVSLLLDSGQFQCYEPKSFQEWT